MSTSNQSLATVLVCGRGAVGMTMGDLFAKTLPQGQFAFLCDPARARRYASKPVQVNGTVTQYPILASDSSKPFVADLILFACKAYSLDEAMEQARPFMNEQTILMSAINGISSEEKLMKTFPNNPVIHTIAQNMDSRYDPHEQTLQFSTRGELVFGVIAPELEEKADQVQELFDRCHLPYTRSQTILLDQYSKLMFNCGINQVCAAYQATYGQVAADPKLNQIFRQAMEEARRVLAGLGTDPGKERMENWAARLSTLDPDSMPSMAQDVMYHRPVELELFSGTIVPKAREFNIPVPVLEDLMTRIEKRVASF
ncbi:2-dehydropantoate 2-reductase [Allobaculum sp. JKK-2023]|uniref:ketopantoate reductase family protein n=1 Tax=Allobaculum sp. JKK-2023 TaxID=3108943 RepID=UPI002B05ED97|nr:2-dehydropantoate 2-reductase [Allobaculum sp. JKK-2023]